MEEGGKVGEEEGERFKKETENKSPARASGKYKGATIRGRSHWPITSCHPPITM